MNATITYRRIFSDCSGATALVEVPVHRFGALNGPRFLFALDLLGDVKCNFVGIRGDDGEPVTAWARHVAAARAVYMFEIADRLSPAWRAANAAMYAEGASS